VHPNSEDGDAVRDHTQRATWLGEKVVLDVGLLRKFEAMNSQNAVEEKKE
jgi:DOPA 4,5-dioxygenase